MIRAAFGGRPEELDVEQWAELLGQALWYKQWEARLLAGEVAKAMAGGEA